MKGAKGGDGGELRAGSDWIEGSDRSEWNERERKWELCVLMILNHNIFLIYFSNFNIDIDISRTWN